MRFHSARKPTHEGEVGLVDLGDSVVAGIEVSGVFGKRWYTIQPQVVTVDRTTKARAQQASGHTWTTWIRRRRGGGNKIGKSKRLIVFQRTVNGISLLTLKKQQILILRAKSIRSGFGIPGFCRQVPKGTEFFIMLL